ncbi:MAG: PIN domain-containing protein [Planctomycetaceae bacterium]
MNVYVETNFLLELAFVQEQHESCDAIVDLCAAGTAHLIVPTFCIAEAFETLLRRKGRRGQIKEQLSRELGQLSRSKPYEQEAAVFLEFTDLLARSSQEEDQRLGEVFDRVLGIAEILALSLRIMQEAARYRIAYEFAPQDSIVFASVVDHLKTAGGSESCFLNRNRLDFDIPGIKDLFDPLGCKMLFSFVKASHYIRHRVDASSDQ